MGCSLRMKNLLPVAIAITVSGVCCIIAAYFCHFYYTLYRRASTELQQSVDSRIRDLQQEVDRLAKQKHFRPIRARVFISTTDLQPDNLLGAGTNNPSEFQLGFSKMGWVILPELRLPAWSPGFQEFRITLQPPGTRVMDAWVSPPGLAEGLAAFETFAILPDEGTNSLTLRVRAKPGASLRREFTIVVLTDSEHDDGQ